MSLTALPRWAWIAISGLALLQPGSAEAAQNPNPTAQESSPSGQAFKIAGTVVNAMTGAPLSQARISIADTKDRAKVTSMITSESGHFEFLQLKPGKYSLQGAKRGFLSAAYEQHEQFSTAIVTGAEFSTENLVLRLTPMALISGHVFDEFGDPVRNAQVVLYFENHNGGITRTARLFNSTTDDRGFFDFNMLRPGNYFISVTAKPWYAIHPVTAPEASGHRASQVSPSLDVVYPTTYYNGASEADRATSIEVKGGDRLQFEMHLNPTPALHLVLRVPLDERGQQTGFTMPTLQKRVFDSVQFVQMEGMQPVAPGVYEVSGVPPGRYTVRTQNSNSGQMEVSADIDLAHDGQELSNSRGEPLGSLKVTVKMPGQEPLPKQYFLGLQDSRLRLVAFKQGDPSGQLSFENLAPGKYAIRFGSQTKPYSVVRTFSPAGDSPGHDVMVTPGAALDLTAVLSVGVVNIEGVVHKKDKPVAGIMVALVPKDPAGNIELFRRDQSDFDGTFLLQGVIPGSYTIVAIEDAWGLDWLQPNVLARYVQYGQSLTIGELMRGSVHLPDSVEVQPH
jgi:protocatechuate 3,4-dioxygenase beta subunit